MLFCLALKDCLQVDPFTITDYFTTLVRESFELSVTQVTLFPDFLNGFDTSLAFLSYVCNLLIKLIMSKFSREHVWSLIKS